MSPTRWLLVHDDGVGGRQQVADGLADLFGRELAAARAAGAMGAASAGALCSAPTAPAGARLAAASWSGDKGVDAVQPSGTRSPSSCRDRWKKETGDLLSTSIRCSTRRRAARRPSRQIGHAFDGGANRRRVRMPGGGSVRHTASYAPCRGEMRAANSNGPPARRWPPSSSTVTLAASNQASDGWRWPEMASSAGAGTTGAGGGYQARLRPRTRRPAG